VGTGVPLGLSIRSRTPSRPGCCSSGRMLLVGEMNASASWPRRRHAAAVRDGAAQPLAPSKWLSARVLRCQCFLSLRRRSVLSRHADKVAPALEALLLRYSQRHRPPDSRCFRVRRHPQYLSRGMAVLPSPIISLIHRTRRRQNSAAPDLFSVYPHHTWSWHSRFLQRSWSGNLGSVL
jgi:hypothetical protein